MCAMIDNIRASRSIRSNQLHRERQTKRDNLYIILLFPTQGGPKRLPGVSVAEPDLMLSVLLPHHPV